MEGFNTKLHFIMGSVEGTGVTTEETDDLCAGRWVLSAETEEDREQTQKMGCVLALSIEANQLLFSNT